MRLLLFQLAADVRPKFLHYQSQSVVADLRTPDFRGVRQRFIFMGMIAVGRDARGEGASHDFRVIQLRPA